MPFPRAYVWDTITILDVQATASSGAVSWVELPPGIKNFQVTIDQSGTATSVLLYHTVQSDAQPQAGGLLCDLDAGSATSYVATDTSFSPRYVGAHTSATAESHITAVAAFQKPWGGVN